VQAPFGAHSMCRTASLTACCGNAGTPAHAPSSNTTARAPAPSASNYGNSSTTSTSSTSPPPDAVVSLNIPLQSPAQVLLQLVSSPNLVSHSPALNASPFFSAAISCERTSNLCLLLPHSKLLRLPPLQRLLPMLLLNPLLLCHHNHSSQIQFLYQPRHHLVWLQMHGGLWYCPI